MVRSGRDATNELKATCSGDGRVNPAVPQARWRWHARHPRELEGLCPHWGLRGCQAQVQQHLPRSPFKVALWSPQPIWQINSIFLPLAEKATSASLPVVMSVPGWEEDAGASVSWHGGRTAEHHCRSPPASDQPGVPQAPRLRGAFG